MLINNRARAELEKVANSQQIILAKCKLLHYTSASIWTSCYQQSFSELYSTVTKKSRTTQELGGKRGKSKASWSERQKAQDCAHSSRKYARKSEFVCVQWRFRYKSSRLKIEQENRQENNARNFTQQCKQCRSRMQATRRCRWIFGDCPCEVRFTVPRCVACAYHKFCWTCPSHRAANHTATCCQSQESSHDAARPNIMTAGRRRPTPSRLHGRTRTSAANSQLPSSVRRLL